MGLFSIFQKKTAQPAAPATDSGSSKGALLAFLREKMPKEYPAAPCYKLEAVENGDGTFSVEMHLELKTTNSEVAEFESSYLLDDVFRGAPATVSHYTLVYYGYGKPLCTVTRGKDGVLFITENGQTNKINL